MTHRSEAGTAAARSIACTSCAQSFPEADFPHQCPRCGGIYGFSEPIRYAVGETGPPSSRGLARYRASLPLPPTAELITLGEGATPLVRYSVEGRPVYFKCEHLNPTGSFKDRGSAVLLSALLGAGVKGAVEDSSGNAGASFAAYAARAGIKARIFVPDYASGPKRAQMDAYGADVVRIMGPRSNATEAVLREVEAGATYASHAYLPHGLAGMATLAFELYEQLGAAPGALITPVGQGSLLLGAHWGFEALFAAGRIDRLPKLISVQAMACAPIWAVQQGGATGLLWTKEQPTIAEGIRILRPLRGDAILAALAATEGAAIAVEEEEIAAGRRELSRRGLFVEPTSAVVWPALMKTLVDLPEPVVVVLTGSGFKDPRNGST